MWLTVNHGCHSDTAGWLFLQARLPEPGQGFGVALVVSGPVIEPAAYGLAGSPAIGSDGSVYFCKNNGYLYVASGTSGLCDSGWPMYQHDARHTGRAAAR